MTPNMPTPTNARKRQFRAALALAGMTAQQFAAEHQVSHGHLCAVARGDRDSEPLEQEIDRFIKKHLVSTNELVA